METYDGGSNAAIIVGSSASWLFSLLHPSFRTDEMRDRTKDVKPPLVHMEKMRVSGIIPPGTQFATFRPFSFLNFSFFLTRRLEPLSPSVCLSNRKKAPAAWRTAAIPFPRANFPGLTLFGENDDDTGETSEKAEGPELEAEIELEDGLQKWLPSAPPLGTFQEEDEWEAPGLAATLNTNTRKSGHPPCIVSAGVLHQCQCDETSLVTEQSGPICTHPQNLSEPQNMHPSFREANISST
jgi:hypothetical protein